MSADLVLQYVGAAFAILAALAYGQLVNVVIRQGERIRFLTRRVWILEGRTPANANQAERELALERERTVRA